MSSGRWEIDQSLQLVKVLGINRKWRGKNYVDWQTRPPAKRHVTVPNERVSIRRVVQPPALCIRPAHCTPNAMPTSPNVQMARQRICPGLG